MSTTYHQLLNTMQSKAFLPIYVFTGEEPFYGDKLIHWLDNHLLNDSEKGFNAVSLYGKDIHISQVIDYAKQYPMGSSHRLILVKEAQHLIKEMDQLLEYVQNPSPTTIIAFHFVNKTLDKRLKVVALLNKNKWLFEFKKLYPNELMDFIQQTAQSKGLHISATLCALIATHSTQLAFILNAIEKLALVLSHKNETHITAEAIENYIGIHRDYNPFELLKSIGNKNKILALKIAKKISEDNSIVFPSIVSLFNFFVNLIQYHLLHDKSKLAVAHQLKINPFFVGDYETAARKYSLKQCTAAIEILKHTDMQLKGVTPNISSWNILYEMIIKLIQ